MRTFGLALVLKADGRCKTPAATFVTVLEEWVAKRGSSARGPAVPLTRTQRIASREGATLREFEFSQVGDVEGRWTTVVRVLESTATPDRVSVSVEMSLDDVADRLAPLKIVVRPPGFLRSLARACVVETIDGFEAPRGLLEVRDSDQVDLLVSEIFSSERKVPLVVVTDTVYAQQPVQGLPEKLASYLFALGRVVHLPPRMTYALTDRLGKELSVFDGGIRVYWPGAQRTDPAFRHPLLLRRTQAEWGPSPVAIEREVCGRIASSLIRAAAPRFRVPDAIGQFLRGEERERLEASTASVQELKDALTGRERERDEAREMEQVAIAENQRLLALLHSLEEDLTAAHAALDTERRKASAFQLALQAKGEPTIDTSAPAEPSTPEEAVERGRVDFSETLLLPRDIFLETDMGPDVYWVLQAMHEACVIDRNGGMKDRRKVFADMLAEALGHPGRYEPGPTGVYATVDEKRVEVKERIHLKNSRPVDTESIYFITVGDGAGRKYQLVRIGRHP